MSLFNDVTRLLVQYVDLKARQYTTEAFDGTRRIITGVAYFAAAGLFLAIGAAFVFTALFFRLSGALSNFMGPALVTGLVALVVCAGLGWTGANAMKQKRAYNEGPIAHNRLL